MPKHARVSVCLIFNGGCCTVCVRFLLLLPFAVLVRNAIDSTFGCTHKSSFDFIYSQMKVVWDISVSRDIRSASPRAKMRWNHKYFDGVSWKDVKQTLKIHSAHKTISIVEPYEIVCLTRPILTVWIKRLALLKRILRKSPQFYRKTFSCISY